MKKILVISFVLFYLCVCTRAKDGVKGWQSVLSNKSKTLIEYITDKEKSPSELVVAFYDKVYKPMIGETLLNKFRLHDYYTTLNKDVAPGDKIIFSYLNDKNEVKETFLTVLDITNVKVRHIWKSNEKIEIKSYTAFRAERKRRSLDFFMCAFNVTNYPNGRVLVDYVISHNNEKITVSLSMGENKQAVKLFSKESFKEYFSKVCKDPLQESLKDTFGGIVY